MTAGCDRRIWRMLRRIEYNADVAGRKYIPLSTIYGSVAMQDLLKTGLRP